MEVRVLFVIMLLNEAPEDRPRCVYKSLRRNWMGEEAFRVGWDEVKVVERADEMLGAETTSAGGNILLFFIVLWMWVWGHRDGVKRT